VCGYALMLTAADVSEMPKICVEPQFRRLGIAQRLLDRLINSAISRGSAELNLEVRVSNTAARKFYEKNGFEFVGTRPLFYSNPYEDAAIMKKELLFF